MSWSRSDSNPTSRETSWRSRGCGCCSTSYGFEFEEDFAWMEPITEIQMKQIISDLKEELAKAESDLKWLKEKPNGTK